MPDNELQKSLPGFNEPIELLCACHEKIRAHCMILEDLVDHINQKGFDSEASSAAKRIRDFFTKSGKLHQQDEENDLFPLLIRQSLKIADLINDLQKEHEQLDALWQNIEHDLMKPDDIDTDKFSQQVHELCTLYRRHMAREESDFFPIARNSLSRRQLMDVGRSMAERRGVRTGFQAGH